MARGGMCKKPFAGNPSMNNLDDDFMAALFKGELTVDQAIALRIIKMSVRDYLYFGLGKNGITPEKFLDAYHYLYIVRAGDPRTWGDCRTRERRRNGDGIFERSTGTLQPKEVQGKCFDTHFSLSELGNRMPMAKFLKLLKAKRETIVNANLKSITSYMSKYRKEEWARLPARRRKGKYDFPRVNVVPTLVSPADIRALGMLYLFGRSIIVKEERNSMGKTPATVLKYKKLLFEGDL